MTNPFTRYLHGFRGGRNNKETGGKKMMWLWPPEGRPIKNFRLNVDGRKVAVFAYREAGAEKEIYGPI